MWRRSARLGIRGSATIFAGGMCRFVCFTSRHLLFCRLVITLFITFCQIIPVVLLQCRGKLKIGLKPKQTLLFISSCAQIYPPAFLLSRVSRARPPRHDNAPHAPLHLLYYSYPQPHRDTCRTRLIKEEQPPVLWARPERVEVPPTLSAGG